MQEPPYPAIIILFSTSVGLLALAVFLLLKISRSLARIQRHLAATPASQPGVPEESGVDDPAPGGAFETFLDEDPERRSMARKDQFAAYRNWRRAKGLNWSAPGD